MNKKIIGLSLFILLILTSVGSINANYLEKESQLVHQPSYTPPNAPSDPEPADGATNVNTKTHLGWKCINPDPMNTTIYFDIYFGTSFPPPKIVENYWDGDGDWYDYYDLDRLSPNTRYVWKIVAKYENGENVSGPLWDFTTWPPKPDIKSEMYWDHYIFDLNIWRFNTYEQKIRIRNAGDPGSKLDWEVFYDYPANHPNWGSWDIDPLRGYELEPSYGSVTITFSFRAGIFDDSTYLSFHVVNKENPDDYIWISYIIKVNTLSRTRQYNTPFLHFLENHPNMFIILQRLLQRIET